MESRTPAVPFKSKPACRRHIPKQRHRVTNWAEYEAGLRARGSLRVWFTPEAIAAWVAAPRTSRGGQPCYSDLAIATTLTLRAVFRLALRQAEGLIGSVLQLLGRPPVAGSQHPQPLGRDAGGAAIKGGQRAGAPAGGRHGAEALRRKRVASGEARRQAAPGLESAASRDGRRHRPDRWGSGVLYQQRRLRPQRRLGSVRKAPESGGKPGAMPGGEP